MIKGEMAKPRKLSEMFTLTVLWFLSHKLQLKILDMHLDLMNYSQITFN